MSHQHGTTNLTDHRPVKALVGLTSDKAFWSLVHAHGLPCYKLNQRVIRFRMSEVEQWLAERKKGGAL